MTEHFVERAVERFGLEEDDAWLLRGEVKRAISSCDGAFAQQVALRKFRRDPLIEHWRVKIGDESAIICWDALAETPLTIIQESEARGMEGREIR